MQQFDVKRGSRKCCVTEQLFGPGVFFYSALIETSSGAIRKDYSCAEWEKSRWNQRDNQDRPAPLQSGSPENGEDQSLIGWWKQRVPDLDSGKVYWAPDHVLIAWFDSLYARQNEKDASLNDTAWVMALLLMQKRLLAREAQKSEENTLYLINRKTKQQYELREPEIDAGRIAAIQKRLEEQLFSDLPVTEEE